VTIFAIPDADKKEETSMKTNQPANSGAGDRVTAGKLMVDMKVLAADTEQLLKATAGQTGQLVARARAKATESLEAAKACVADLQDVALAKTRDAGRATDDFVRANPWRVMSMGAIAGLALGILLARGKPPNS
jgi:ElaB/YqjD/DUF883 family membrane-anchored ribosome-binding protein